MKKLVFKNGVEVSLTDDSTSLKCNVVVKTFAEADELRDNFTEENLKGATLDGESLENIVPVCIEAIANVGENIVVSLKNREKSHDEIVDEKLIELQEALTEL